MVAFLFYIMRLGLYLYQ